MNLLALTNCVVDYYPQLGQSFLGGNSLNVASMWRYLEPEARVSVITRLGNDANADIIMTFLSRKQIDTSRVYRVQGVTANNQLRVDAHGERFGIEGTWQGGVFTDFQLSGSDWEFLGQQNMVAIPANNPNFQTLIINKPSGCLLSVDYLDVLNQLPIADTLLVTDIAFVAATRANLPELKALAVATQKLLVVTLGANGSMAYFNNAEYYQPAIKVNKVVDTTGCGDAYQAAFALAYYKTGNIPHAMLQGAKAASLILQHWGGVGNLL